MKRNTKTAEASSGNVYADLGFGDAAEMKAKAQLVAEIARVIHDRKLTQVEAAKQMGINQPKVSALLKGQFSGYSQERLIGFLNRLGHDVEIIVRPASPPANVGTISVVLG